MPFSSSESHSLEDSSSSHSFIPPDLTGQITNFDNQYCAAGGFGDVYRCQYHSECGIKEVAVKTFRFEFMVEEDIDGRSSRMIRRELGIWRRLSHPNIVPFLGTVSGFGRFGNASLVSAWMPNGTLQDFLLKYDGKLTVAHRLQFMLGIANGLQYLHSLSIVHGDLTCTNVLLDEKHNARLTDFGYASLVGEIPEALAYLQASTLRPGAVRWAAPEYFFSNPEETVHCTTKSDVYSFGNITLQVLSGKLPWSEFRRDVVVVLHLAQGDKPRRPQSHPIDDQHWHFIEHCWSPVQERPSAEQLVSCILDFLRSYPHPQPVCNLLVSSERSSPQSTLRGPLLSSPNIGQFSLDIPCTFRDLHSVAQNRHDQSPVVGGLSPPRIVQCPPQLIPDSNSSTPPLLPRKLRTYSGSEDDHGNGAASRASRFQSTLENHNQNGLAVTPDTFDTDAVFPKRPPPAHSKSGAASPPFLNTSFIGQDQLNSYPFLYPPSQQHSVHHHSQKTTAFGLHDRGAASGSHDERGGIWSYLSSRFSQHAQKTPAKFNPQPNPRPMMQQPPDFSPPFYESPSFGYLTTSAFSLANTSSQICGVANPAASRNSATECEDGGLSPLGMTPRGFVPILGGPPFAMSIPPQSQRKAPLRSRGGSDATWSASSSNRPSPYPSPSMGPRIRYEGLSHPTLSGPPLQLPCPDSLQPNNSGLTTVRVETVTCERTAGANHRRRKQDTNYLCPVPGCGSTFTRSFNLKGHMRFHDEERPFQCKWPGCGKGFARQHDCKRHEQLHSIHRPFTCEGCNKTFARVDVLNRHLSSEGGAECQRIPDAFKDSEGPLIPKGEEEAWPGTSGLIPDHADSSLLPQVTLSVDVV